MNGFFCNSNAWRNVKQKSRCGLQTGSHGTHLLPLELEAAAGRSVLLDEYSDQVLFAVLGRNKMADKTQIKGCKSGSMKEKKKNSEIVQRIFM